jgi:hypothetical protein
MVGVKCMTLIPARLSHPSSRSDEPTLSGSRMWSVAPRLSGVKTSRNSGSCARPDSMLKWSASLKANVWLCQAMKCDSGRWVPAMALGVPVVPEVKAM